MSISVKMLVVAFCVFWTGHASADQGASQPLDISWYLFDYPPAYITEGPFKGQGYQDQILSELEQSVPSIRINRIVTSMARFMSNMEHGKASCAGALAKTPERMAHMVFSDPILVSLPIRLVIRADMVKAISPFLDEKGQVLLPALRKTTGLMGGMVQGRAYGSKLDKFLENAAAEGSVIRAGDADLIFRMLGRGRIGYAFGYPDEVEFHARLLEHGGDAAKFVTLPIAGHAAYAQSYVGCTDDAAGVAFVASVNRILARNKGRSPWQAYYLGWIDASARADVTATLIRDIQ